MRQWKLLDLKLFRWSGFAICFKRESVSAQKLAQLDSVNSIEYPVKVPKKLELVLLIRSAMKSTRTDSVFRTDEPECLLHLHLSR